MATAVTAAETGHLIFSTLHTNSASQTIDRIIDSFPPNQQRQIRVQLAGSLIGIFSQRLVPRVSGGLIPAYELLVDSNAVSNLIREGRTAEIDVVIETGADKGMIDLNSSLADLVRQGEISTETAYRFSMNPKIGSLAIIIKHHAFSSKLPIKRPRPKWRIEAPTRDVAIGALQKRGLIVINIKEEGDHGLWGLGLKSILNRVHPRDVVILSRQIATLFEAKVSVLSTFRLIAVENSNPVLQKKLTQVTDDVKTGVPISTALAKHPDVFTDFYVNMVRSGEESGKLAETFTYLADYLDRSYALMSKAKNALIYPIFVILSFVAVMVLMMTFVIPRLSEILIETGQELPIYTKVVIGLSQFMADYILLLVVLVVVIIAFLLKYLPTEAGRMASSRFKLSIPYVGNLYRKLYLSRIADNLNTLITSGVSMVRSIEITAEVVGNDVYREILEEAADLIKSGNSVSEILSRHKEIPSIMSQMIKVGEESGKLTFVLVLCPSFISAGGHWVDTLVGLIEPAMIVLLGLAVGILLTSVLVPIYNVASGF